MHAGNLTGTVLPLIRRYPSLVAVPRVVLSTGPTPVEHVPSVHANLWIKRDDVFADPMGGNKARALEFLLGNVLHDDLLVTVGSEGSTHVLAVATYGRRLGAHVAVGRWRQVMNPTAARISELTARVADEAPMFRTIAGAYAWAWRRRRAHGARWIAAGGATPLGVLGHLNAGLELVDQIHAGVLPPPARVVVPFGTGGDVGRARARVRDRRPEDDRRRRTRGVARRRPKRARATPRVGHRAPHRRARAASCGAPRARLDVRRARRVRRRVRAGDRARERRRRASARRGRASSSTRRTRPKHFRSHWISRSTDRPCSG